LIIVMNQGAPDGAIDRVVAEIERMGSKAHLSRGTFRTVIGAVGEEGVLDQVHLSSLDGVEKVVPIMKPYKLASREFHDEDSIVEIGGQNVPRVKVGGPHAVCIAGPCAVENEEMLKTRGRPFFAAGCSSRGRRLTRSRGTVSRRSSGCGRAATSWACRSASRSWTPARSR
jgi:3-deoxy-7-phosphoheptulonate synthase